MARFLSLAAIFACVDAQLLAHGKPLAHASTKAPSTDGKPPLSSTKPPLSSTDGKPPLSSTDDEIKNSQELLPSRDEEPHYLDHPVVHITGLSVLGALALGCVGANGYLIYGKAVYGIFKITPQREVDITIYSVMEAVSVGLVGVIAYLMYEEIYAWVGSDAKLMETDGTEPVEGDDVAEEEEEEEEEENIEADAVAGDVKNTTSTKAPSTDGKPPLSSTKQPLSSTKQPLSSTDGNSAMSYGISVVALLMALCF